MEAEHIEDFTLPQVYPNPGESIFPGLRSLQLEVKGKCGSYNLSSALTDFANKKVDELTLADSDFVKNRPDLRSFFHVWLAMPNLTTIRLGSLDNTSWKALDIARTFSVLKNLKHLEVKLETHEAAFFSALTTLPCLRTATIQSIGILPDQPPISTLDSPCPTSTIEEMEFTGYQDEVQTLTPSIL